MRSNSRREGAKGSRLASAGAATKLVAAGALTWLPQRWDGPVLEAVAAITAVARKKRLARLARFMAECLGPDQDWERVARSNLLVRSHGFWARARAMHRRGWSATLEVEGLDHLETAIGAGKGAILWRMDFCGSHIPKQALFERGHRLIHVSRPEHGMPRDDVLGRLVTAPLYRRAETRFLAERIEIEPGASLDYLRLLLDRLRGTGVLSIMAEFPGRAAITTELLGRQIHLATGAPSLARSSGAALLTMHARHLGYDHYNIVIDPPIGLTGSTRRTRLSHAVEEFVERLERTIRRHPASWLGWERLLAARSDLRSPP